MTTELHLDGPVTYGAGAFQVKCTCGDVFRNGDRDAVRSDQLEHANAAAAGLLVARRFAAVTQDRPEVSEAVTNVRNDIRHLGWAVESGSWDREHDAATLLAYSASRLIEILTGE